MEILQQVISNTGFANMHWQMFIMWGIVIALLYLAIVKQFEPLLLIPISMGCLVVNLPVHDQILGAPKIQEQIVTVEEAAHLKGFHFDVKSIQESDVEQANLLALYLEQENQKGTESEEVAAVVKQLKDKETKLVKVAQIKESGGLMGWFNLGIVLEIFPPIIFMGVGALTDFGPLIANPRTLLLGAAAQFGIFATFLGAIGLGQAGLMNFGPEEAAAIGIIGGADGPTSIFVANKLAPDLLGAIAVAAYSYMALVPVIQPPIMKLLTTEKERKIRMKSLRQVSKFEKVSFAIVVMVFCLMIIPSAAPLVSMFFIGNLIRECGVTERLVKAAQNEIINVVTIFLGISVGLKMSWDKFLNPETLGILGLGVVAFCIATSSGVLMAKLMNVFQKNKINPLIGSAGVSAVPMAARVSHVEGQKADPQNFLLMHAMGPNVAGVIGSALAAGFFISTLT